MRPGVVADEVSGGLDAADESGLCIGVAANEEESGADVMLGENVEQPRSAGGVGTVVKGESEFTGAARGGQRESKELRARRHGGVGVAAGDEAETGESTETGFDSGVQCDEHDVLQCATLHTGTARADGV